MSQLNIFFLGATGYIGGNVLQHLLRHPSFSKFNIITLARSDEKAEKLREFGVAAIVGSLQDLQLLENQATVSDIVIATANVDDLDAARAILRGLKKRYTEQGKVPLLIHTSGTGLLMRDTQGNSVGFDVPYDDSNPEQLETIPKTAPHRKVGLEVIAADTEGYVRSYIILPSTIYGILKGPLVDAGIVNPYSQQVPLLIRAALDRGMGGMYGLGKNIWNHVHADDLSDLYTLVLDGALKDTVGHGREGLYFGENGEYAYYDVAKAISDALVKLGRSGNPEAISFTEKEKQKYYNGSKFLGTSSRAIATRSRSIGWRPKNTTDDLLASILPEVEAFISRTHA